MGTKVAPKPTDNEALKMKRVRRLNGIRCTIAIPDTATAQNRKVVIPPRTEAGMETIAAENLAKTPMIIKNPLYYVSIIIVVSEEGRAYAAQYPAFLFAQRVRAMTPLFWAKVLIGVIVINAARRPLQPSAKMPP